MSTNLASYLSITLINKNLFQIQIKRYAKEKKELLNEVRTNYRIIDNHHRRHFDLLSRSTQSFARGRKTKKRNKR